MDVSPDKRGSFEDYTVRLAAGLRAAGWRTVQAFWGPPPRWLESELREAGAEIVVLTAQPELAGGTSWPPGLRRDWQLAQLLRRIVRTIAPDLVHLHFCVLFSVLPFALRAGGARTILATEHISLPFARRSLPRDLLVRARNAACMTVVERILPVSEYVRRRLLVSDHVPPGKATVLYNGIDLARFQPPSESPAMVRAEIRRRLGIPADHLVVAAVGQLIAAKGFVHLVDAAFLLRDRPRTTFVLVGDGAERPALAEQIARLELGERVRLLGKRDDVPEILRASDVFVCPSVWDEALGYVILEAMSAGLPAVASRVGGIPEVVAEGETGLLVPPRDPSVLAAAIGSLLDDPATRERLGRAGRRAVEERFSLARAVERTIALYGELVLVHPPGRAEARLRAASL
jgi:glycosyltransferase involved in cell wall biosynthesis